MPSRPRCAVCGSKQWRKEPFSGLITCGEGHVLQNYRNETREVTELGPHSLHKRTIKSTRKKRERQSKANPKLYHGDRARYHYFQCLQLILRLQIAALTKVWDLPPEFEVICRDIWALHLSLLPNSPPAEPYLYALDEAGQKQPVEDANAGAEDNMGTTKPAERDQDHEQSAAADRDNEQDDDESNTSSSGEDEIDPELEKLLRENSEAPSSSEDDEAPRPKPDSTGNKGKGREAHHGYDAPAGNISVLMLACWTIRLPVTYMDFVRLIEAYDLPYLDPVRLLPESLALHLTRQTTQALSPLFAPTAMHIHRLTQRLAKLLNRKYGVYTPEYNTAPLLWRVVRSLHGNSTLYILTKKLGHILQLPMTLHYSLSPKLRQTKHLDPEHHKYDNAPVEVALVAVVIVVMKLAYGLDERRRVPRSTGDAACALPKFAQLIAAIRNSTGEGENTWEALLSSDSAVSALEMDDTMIDEYFDFCQKALLPHEPRPERHSLLGEYFPLTSRTVGTVEQSDSSPLSHPSPNAPPPTFSAVQVHEDSSELTPGQAYAIYNTQDELGSLPADLDVIVRSSAKWTGVEEDYICGVVERYEHRLSRWWAGVRKKQREGDDTVAARTPNVGANDTA